MRNTVSKNIHGMTDAASAELIQRHSEQHRAMQ